MDESFEYKPIVPKITENFNLPIDKIDKTQNVHTLKSKLANNDL
jgi:hypothetical protein